MSLEDLWKEAIQQTEIVRLPVKRLHTFGNSHIDYIFLAESQVNRGDTVVRKGKLDIQRPSLILPQQMPHFEGFDKDSDNAIRNEQLQSFFYTRGISFPQLQYKNETYELDLFEGSLAKAERSYADYVSTHEKISTGIVIGNDASWQFSTLLLACHMIDTHIESDLKTILDRIRKK